MPMEKAIAWILSWSKAFVISQNLSYFKIKVQKITPETLNEEADLIYGIGKQKDRLITILKVEYLLKRAF